MAFTDSLQNQLPNLSTSTIVNYMLYTVLFLLLLIALALSSYFLIRRLKYKYKIVIFEKINNSFEPARRDKAMLVKFGTGGDTLFWIRKMKKFVPVPEIQTGRNTYWFFLRQDGELINFGPGDFDEQAKTMGARFLDKEMRYARVSLQGHWKERYEKPNFLEKYASLIVNVLVIVIIMVFLFLIVDKMLDAIGSIEQLIQSSAELQEANQKVLGAIDNVLAGSGIKR